MFEVLSIFLLTTLIYFWLKFGDEIPAILFLFWAYSIFYRYLAISSGLTDFINPGYGYFVMDFSLLDTSLEYTFWGTLFFSVFYMLFRLVNSEKMDIKIRNELFPEYIRSNQNTIIIGSFLIIVLMSLSNSYLGEASELGLSLAFEVSNYALLFSLGIGSVIILTYLSIFTKPKISNVILTKDESIQSIFNNILLIILFIAAIFLAYNITLRFQILSWVIVLFMFISLRFSIFKRTIIYLVAGGLIAIVFAVAGVERDPLSKYMSYDEKLEAGLNRLMLAEDNNYLDGFMMVYQVYPHYLNFAYGMEHIEILLRPIPRMLWPDKPVGGWVNKLGLQDASSKTTIGISPTLYGDFYAEAGLVGIMLFSSLYGIILGLWMKYVSRQEYYLKALLKGITIASLLPLLRGGDIPGVAAFIGMSYWPIFILFLGFKNYKKKQI